MEEFGLAINLVNFECLRCYVPRPVFEAQVAKVGKVRDLIHESSGNVRPIRFLLGVIGLAIGIVFWV